MYKNVAAKPCTLYMVIQSWGVLITMSILSVLFLSFGLASGTPPHLGGGSGPSIPIDSDVIPLEVEGVYELQGPDGLPLVLTILQSVRTQKLTLTISRANANVKFFYASDVKFTEQGSSQFLVTSVGSDMMGIRTEILMEIDVPTGTLRGTVDGNFLKTDELIELKGQKVKSIYESWTKSVSRSCEDYKMYLGTYSGTAARPSGEKKEVTLNIREMKDKNGNPVLAGNYGTDLSRIRFHDGYYSQSLRLLTLVNDVQFAFTGDMKKLMLMCDQDEKDYILRGFHFSSAGTIVRDIELRKPKNL